MTLAVDILANAIRANPRSLGAAALAERYLRALHAAGYVIKKRDENLKLLSDLITHIDRITCTHENTHRGGVIWTICEDCGMKWADDRGGFVPHKDAPEVAAARSALAKTR